MSDLVLTAEKGTGLVTSAGTTEVAARWIPFECGFCGATGGQYLGHYEVLRCRCGKSFWALQPKRNGRLKLFEWPGQFVNGVIVK